jgi:hypothetical protein
MGKTFPTSCCFSFRLCAFACLKETPRRRIRVTSSLNKISMDQIQVGNSGGKGVEGYLSASPQSIPFYSRLMDRYLYFMIGWSTDMFLV